ncbi:MAG TPA: two-component regulator propeller domain-containing protein, partial [Chitinophagaceae bacterium]|nr:two-component regulator propeller domain-containing protein [Chitinophagaceae bacterium]
MKNIVFLLILYCAGFSASGQLLPYHRYTSKDGLIADRITVIQQDEQGVMWFGSYFGLGNYDGISFQKIPLPFEQRNKYVTSILPFKRKIYAGFLFGGGLAEFSNGQVKAYSLLSIDPRTSNDVIAICKFDNSSILVANGRNEIYQFRNGKFTRLYSLFEELPSYAVQHMLLDEKNQLWIATGDGLFIIPLSGEKRMQSFFRKSAIISLMRSSNGKMQMAMTNGTAGSVFQCDGLSGNTLLNLSKMADIPGL